MAAWWQTSYNHHRPHSSLGYQTSAEFAATGCVPAGLPNAKRNVRLREHSPREPEAITLARYGSLMPWL